MTSPLQKAEIDRTALQLKLTIIERRIALHSTSPISAGGVNLLLKKVESVIASLNEVHMRIAHLVDPADMDTHNDLFVNWTERLDNAAFLLIEIKEQQAAAAPSPPPTASHRPVVKLPEMQLPSFNGKFEDWPSFEDLFKATIDSNTSLSGSQKLQYLKSCVKDDASSLIKSFTVTDANYVEAWNLLCSRYNNTREIVYSLVKKIANQPRINSESVSSLQTLLNSTLENVRALKVLGRPTDQWDDMLVVTIIEKLDSDTKSEWAKSLTGTSPTTFEDVTLFLERHIRSLMARGSTTTKVTSSSANNKYQAQQQGSRQHAKSHHLSFVSCSLCKGNHSLYQCSKLLELQPPARLAAVKKTSACLNCLREGHSIRNCNSKHSCKQCSRKHHTLLHLNSNENSGDQQPPPPAVGSVRSHTSSSLYPVESSVVLLKTAIAYILDSLGNQRPVRVLLDDGSEASFITESLVTSLGLNRKPTNVLVTGISATNAARVNSMVTVRLHSCIHDAHVDVETLILAKVTGTLPRIPCDTNQWTHLHGIQLADPTYARPGDIDILLGADVVASIMRDGRRQGPASTPIAQNSIFGWVLSGKVAVMQQRVIRSNHTSCRLEELVQRFWEVEQVPTRKPLSTEEAACETLFSLTTTRTETGRYIVRLPFRKNEDSTLLINNIGDTRALAERRLFQLERRFQRYPQHHAAYKDFMREYLDLGHMRIATPTTLINPVYIPHHFVTKDDSSTTKLRVVFDASMQSSNGVSLNSTLMVGPTVQDDLFALLIRFRFHVVALKADIAMMYRQFGVHPEDWNYQRILWREDQSQPIKEYVLTTVTYGTAPAPYLATRCAQHMGEDEKEAFPKAAEVLQKDSYVDDLISGESSTQAATKLANDLIALTKRGGMNMRKWCSNDPDVMKSIPPELRESGAELTFDEDAAVKALGITWQPTKDVFTFYTKTKTTAFTKRELLSEIAKTFDPLGWLSPFTITAKIMFQELWQLSVDWDDTMDHEHQAKWTEYQQQLQLLSSLQIPRSIVKPNVVNYEIHGFSDASLKAYGAALDLRCKQDNGNIIVNLITAKSKVSPISSLSIPRLELCGALLLAELIEAFLNATKLTCSAYCYTDNMCVLKWISSPSRRWKTYVANRVAAIHEITSPDQWHHVRTHENPADLPSRGISAQDLINSDLWWKGPQWLSTEDPAPVTSDILDMKHVLLEEKPKPILTLHITAEVPFIIKWVEKFSDLRKATSTTAVYQQFIQFLKSKHGKEPKVISVKNRKEALLTLIKHTQQHYWKDELKKIQAGEEVASSSKLKTLAPFVDEGGILRVGGRLQNSSIPEERKHPIVLPKHSHLTSLIISHEHDRHFHAGVRLTLAAIQQQYWIIGDQAIVTLTLKKCIVCKKAKAQTIYQQMGNLPTGRVTPNRPFSHAGVDFAGPFMVKFKTGRGCRGEKCYFAIFVCLATKAIHLEIVSSLSTPAFIACYRRFIARRGISTDLYSDCGTNFVGADRELKQDLIKAETEYQQQLSHLGTTWHFNPPGSPHQGGLWEAGVKSVKHHLRRIMGNNLLTMEQFQTLLCNIEACLNSRPLITFSSDPSDFAVLTPGHFLVGSPLTAVPEPSLLDVNQNRLSYWQVVEQRTQHFWSRWYKEYLTSLQSRSKWMRKQPNVSIGDLVAIRDENLPPTKWKLGRVISIHPGADELVRKVTLRTIIDVNSTPVKYGEITRAVHKLSPILNSNEMQ